MRRDKMGCDEDVRHTRRLHLLLLRASCSNLQPPAVAVAVLFTCYLLSCAQLLCV